MRLESFHRRRRLKYETSKSKLVIKDHFYFLVKQRKYFLLPTKITCYVPFLYFDGYNVNSFFFFENLKKKNTYLKLNT